MFLPLFRALCSHTMGSKDYNQKGRKSANAKLPALNQNRNVVRLVEGAGAWGLTSAR